jgi:hypothetical protein
MGRTRDRILEGMASIFWATAWADHVEEHRCCSLSGVEITEVMPSIPESARTLASEVLKQIDAASTQPADALYDAAPNPKSGAHRFGNCLAFSTMGAGVSWEDDDDAIPGLIIPYGSDAEFDLRLHADATCEEGPNAMWASSTKHLIQLMEERTACPRALRWVRDNAHRTPMELWEVCPNVSWLTFFAFGILLLDANGWDAVNSDLYELGAQLTVIAVEHFRHAPAFEATYLDAMGAFSEDELFNSEEGRLFLAWGAERFRGILPWGVLLQRYERTK